MAASGMLAAAVMEASAMAAATTAAAGMAATGMAAAGVAAEAKVAAGMAVAEMAAAATAAAGMAAAAKVAAGLGSEGTRLPSKRLAFSTYWVVDARDMCRILTFFWIVGRILGTLELGGAMGRLWVYGTLIRVRRRGFGDLLPHRVASSSVHMSPLYLPWSKRVMKSARSSVHS